MEDKVEIPLQEFPFVQRYTKELSDIIYTKFGCLVLFEGVDGDFSSTKHRRAPLKPEKRFEQTLRSGVKVSVWKADLSCFKEADAVVNAANTSLSHGGGLAQALSDAGGPKIQQESRDHIDKYGPLKTGDAVVMSAGLLPCKKIIHAVGPDLPIKPSTYQVDKAKPYLKKAIENILKKVAEEHLSSVAIPAISSGLFNYPLSDCAQTIVSTVKDYYDNQSHGKHRPKEVFFVNNDEPTVSEMEHACRKIPWSGPPSYSQAAAHNTRSATKVYNTLTTLNVIVNTASEKRELSIGAVSKALLNKAGDEMQKEIKWANKNKHIVSTKAYKLKCREVYHTFCCTSFFSPQIFYESITECLWTAASSRYESISFPAIGTGNLGFSESEAASIMLNAVTQFAPYCPKSLAVYFVIYPSDHKVFQVLSLICSSPALGTPNFSPSRREPRIILQGPSRESVREAEKWLKDLFYSSKKIIIYNNFILHFGNKDFNLLSRWNKDGVSIEEILSQGHACIVINSKSEENLFSTVVNVEALLCQVQNDFVSEEERELELHSCSKGHSRRQQVDHGSKEFSERYSAFRDQPLRVVKVERVENRALEVMFNMKKDQMSLSTSQTMFQCISAQFCDMICKIGFHAECAPPEDTFYGEGIYFTNSIQEALDLWKSRMEEYVYFVEAQVLTGKPTKGKQGMILPPPVGTDSDKLYDSVYGGSGTAVIFSGYQALPKYIITCKRSGNFSSRFYLGPTDII
uniref:Poly [ADP-ribose] polymerase n=1 Tax=Oryzias melastigma TaxID=30732 RepID=A0A3B3BUS4_ORYME